MLALVQTEKEESNRKIRMPRSHLRLVHSEISTKDVLGYELKVLIYSLVGLIAFLSMIVSLRAVQGSTTFPDEGASSVVADTFAYTVNPGETIWSIAKIYADDDPREIVYEVAELNGGEQISAGQTLHIPTKYLV